jgi:hypothetical protein
VRNWEYPLWGHQPRLQVEGALGNFDEVYKICVKDLVSALWRHPRTREQELAVLRALIAFHKQLMAGGSITRYFVELRRSVYAAIRELQDGTATEKE